jgi:hypothetical protein
MPITRRLIRVEHVETLYKTPFKSDIKQHGCIHCLNLGTETYYYKLNTCAVVLEHWCKKCAPEIKDEIEAKAA